MTFKRISSGSSFEAQIGYCRAVVDGDYVFVSGTTGFNYATMQIGADVVEQAEQCLVNIRDALAEAGCELADIVRVRYLLTDRANFEPCWPVFKKYLGAAPPAATMLVAGLYDPRMLIEIEALSATGSRRNRARNRSVGEQRVIELEAPRARPCFIESP